MYAETHFRLKDMQTKSEGMEKDIKNGNKQMTRKPG